MDEVYPDLFSLKLVMSQRTKLLGVLRYQNNKTFVPYQVIRLKWFVKSGFSITNSGNNKIPIDSLSISTLTVAQTNNTMTQDLLFVR